MVRNRESLSNTIIPHAIMAKSDSEENVGLMGRGDELWCVFVCVRVIFASRRLAETRRVK